jgi:hypothetical protein
MRVLCRHGHFAFIPNDAEQISRFASYFDKEVERDGDFYTFPLLAGAPKYSLAGKLFLNLPAVTTFEGEPWEVMRENGFVYSLATGLLVLKESITTLINPPQTGFFFLAQTPLIQPGSRNASGDQVLSYDAEWVQRAYQLRVSEFQYE